MILIQPPSYEHGNTVYHETQQQGTVIDFLRNIDGRPITTCLVSFPTLIGNINQNSPGNIEPGLNEKMAKHQFSTNLFFPYEIPYIIIGIENPSQYFILINKVSGKSHK